MNKDRGTIKWTAMMLPEHVKLLREWQTEDSWVEMPQLDEAQLEEINQHVYTAYKQQQQVRVRVWEHKQMTVYTGFIQKLNEHERYVQLDSGKRITVESICAMTIDG
jgi:hypothetical protein